MLYFFVICDMKNDMCVYGLDIEYIYIYDVIYTHNMYILYVRCDLCMKCIKGVIQILLFSPITFEDLHETKEPKWE